MRPPPQAGEKHLTASVFVFTREAPKRVLLIHHKKTGKWIAPGGHVEPDENPSQTAVREVREETGLDISVYFPASIDAGDDTTLLPLPRYFLEELVPEHGSQPAHFHLDFIYVVEAPYGEVVLDLHEAHDIDWFTYEETLKLETFQDVRTSLKELFFEDNS